MQKIIFLVALIVASHLAAADPIDSLSLELKKSLPEKDRADVLNQLAFLYTNYSVEKAHELASKALMTSTIISYDKGMADAYNVLGICRSIGGKIEESVEYFLAARRIRERLNDQIGVAKILNNLAGTFLTANDFNKALEYTNQSLKTLTGSGDNTAIGNAWLSKAMIYERRQDYDSALASYDVSLAYFRKAGRADKVEDAEISRISIYETTNQYERALSALEALESQPTERKDPAAQLVIAQIKGRIMSRMGNKKEAHLYLLASKKLALESGAKNLLADVLVTLSEEFARWRMYDSAFYYYKQYADLKMEDMSLERSKQSMILENLYRDEQRDRQLEASLNEIGEQRLYIIIAAALLTITVLFSVLVFYFYRKNRNSNLQLIKLNLEILDQKEELTAQAAQLNEVNKRMDEINQNLEEEVKDRTRKILEQNQKLVDYAYFNAHHLRGPLARVLGLINLIKLQPLNAESADMVEKMAESAAELDIVVSEINRHLEEEAYGRNESRE